MERTEGKTVERDGCGGQHATTVGDSDCVRRRSRVKLGDTVTVYCGEESTPTESSRSHPALEAEFTE